MGRPASFILYNNAAFPEEVAERYREENKVGLPVRLAHRAPDVGVGRGTAVADDSHLGILQSIQVPYHIRPPVSVAYNAKPDHDFTVQTIDEKR